MDQVSGTEILRKILTFFWAKCLLTNAVNIRRPPPRRADISRIVKAIIADISAVTEGERERNLLNLSVYIFGFPCWLGRFIPMSAARSIVGAWSSQNKLWERLGPPSRDKGARGRKGRG